MRNLLLLFVLLLTSCAALRPGFEEPTVRVTSFQALPSESVAPRFEIGLHIINPNNFALELQGISYTVSLEGHQVLAGVSNQLPKVAAYGEADLTLQASADLFSTLRLFTDLLQQPRDSFAYELSAKLDVGGLMPKITISKRGDVYLSGGSN